MVQEGVFFQKVLAVRMSYLSRHSGIRQYILQQLDAGHDILQIVRDINVGGVTLDLVGDEKDAFASKLNTLTPGTGDQYAAGVQDDTAFDRQHRWDWWLTRIGQNPGLADVLKQAVTQVLGHDQPVEVGGLYAGGETTVEASGQPRLTFQAPAADLGGDAK